MNLIKEILRIAGIRHGAFYYYSMLMSNSGYPFNTALKALWERDLNITFIENDWDTIVGITKQVSRDIKIRLIQFKILH